METEKLTEITKKANDAIKDLDSDLKKTAFETILKKLLDSEIPPSEPKKPISKKPKRTKQFSKPSRTKAKEIDETVKKLISKINRTEHQEYFSKMTKMLDKALYILKIALDNGVDGLVPSQIEQILKERFRQKGTKNAIGMALMDSKYVDRKPITIQGGNGYAYHLMDPGEEYIKEKIKEWEKENE
ncbi:MAG: hypothetical protein OQK82_03655 [Candidatus Pacearchaeota archaeon]|nr:hypothetical protein [Candidatus Pacearchaeota archaeon]